MEARAFHCPYKHIIPGACPDEDESLASMVPDPWAFIVTVASPGARDLSLMFGSLFCFSAEELETALLCPR